MAGALVQGVARGCKRGSEGFATKHRNGPPNISWSTTFACLPLFGESSSTPLSNLRGAGRQAREGTQWGVGRSVGEGVAARRRRLFS